MREEIKQRIVQIQNDEVPAGYKKINKNFVPREWRFEKLANIIESLESGVSVNSEDIPCGKNQKGVLKTSSVIGGKFFPKENKMIKAIDISRARLNPKKDSIIISRMNTPTLVGEIGYVKEDFDYLYIPDRLWRAELKSNVCARWLSGVLISNRIKAQMHGIATGTSNSMKNISKSSFLSIEVLYPPLAEQQKIATILFTWDKAISLQEKLIDQKKEQKRGLMQRLLTGEVRYRKAGEIFDSASNKNHKGVGRVLSATQENGIIPRNEIDIDIKFDLSSLVNYKKVETGQFVISLRSFQGGIEYSRYEGIVSPAYTVLKNRVPISESFYKHYFKSISFISRLKTIIYGIRDGKQISYKNFSTLKLPCPDLYIQKKTGKILDIAEKEIYLLETKLDALKEQKKGLMQLLLTGIVRVKV